MCNCGNKRMQFATQQNNNMNPNNISAQFTNFEYTGKTALSVTGNYTGRHYRFSRPNDIQAVDNRDAKGIMEISVLKRVS